MTTLHATANVDPVLSAGASFGFLARNCDILFDYFAVIATTP